MEEYLRCTETIDCDAHPIREKARELTYGLTTDEEKAISLYYFVRDQVKHNPYAPVFMPDRYKASTTLQEGNGSCQQKSVLLAALARAVGIPSRIGFVDIYDHLISDRFREMAGGTNLLSLHGYAELFINGKWVHASPAYDIAACRKHRFVPVEFDGVNDAKDSAYDQDGRQHIEHAKDHGTFADFPLDWIREYTRQFVASLGLDFDALMAMGDQIREEKAASRQDTAPPETT